MQIYGDFDGFSLYSDMPSYQDFWCARVCFFLLFARKHPLKSARFSSIRVQIVSNISRKGSLKIQGEHSGGGGSRGPGPGSLL